MIQVTIKHYYILHHSILFNEQIMLFIAVEGDIQKQLFADVLQNRCWNNTHSSQRDTKSHLKKQFHLKSQFPSEMTLLRSHENFHTHLKSNFLSLPSRIYASKCFQDDIFRVTDKQYYTLFQSLHQAILTFSESFFQIKL